MKEYTFSYRFDNKSWAISIWADSKEEVLRKFWALKENGEYSGLEGSHSLVSDYLHFALHWHQVKP